MILEHKRKVTVSLVRGFTKSNGTVVEEYIREYPRKIRSAPKMRQHTHDGPRTPAGHDVMTPWFAEGVKPVRKGNYQRQMLSGIAYSYWTGKFWGMLKVSPEPSPFDSERGPTQELPWRGLR